MQRVLPLPADWLSTWPILTNAWIQAGITAFLTIILSYIVTFIIGRIVKSIASKTKTKADDLIIKENWHRFSWLLITLGFQFALMITPLNSALSNILATISIIIGTTIVMSMSSIVIDEWGYKLAKKTKTDLDEQLIPLLKKTLNVAYGILGFLIILKLWEIDLTPYLTGIGISGLVLGLALQDSLKNIFGGISMIFDRNFHIGDKVKIESGDLGEVMEIGLRSTKLKTYDNETIFIPNGQLANQRIQNYVEPSPPVRVVVPFGVAYGSDVDKVKKIALQTIKKNKYYDPEGSYTDVIMTEMADSSLNFNARFWVKEWNQSYSAKIEATEAIYKALVKNKINIPFPTRTVHLKK